MKLSIITINFNNIDGLKKTFESVVNQTFTDYEWIVIDGGSTDGSREFIEAHQDSFSYWVSEPDHGIYHAMNKGIIRANGEYLNFLNSGDYYADNRTLTEVFEKNLKTDIIYGIEINELSSHVLCSTTMKGSIRWYDFFNSTLPHQSSFIRRSLFDIVGLYDENMKVVSDALWFSMALIFHHATYQYIPQIIAIEQENGISQRSDLSKETQMRREAVFPEYIKIQDIYALRWVDLLRSSKMAYFIFRIAVFVARKKREYQNRHLMRKLLKSAGNLK